MVLVVGFGLGGVEAGEEDGDDDGGDAGRDTGSSVEDEDEDGLVSVSVSFGGADTGRERVVLVGLT